MNKQLTVTCDDCGLSEGINSATADLHERGIATAASIITNFPAAQHAFDLFARYPTLELGVHLNLSDGYPLTEIKRLSPLTWNDGRFQPKGILHLRAFFPGASFLELAEAELRAQIEVFVQAGLRPKHLTTHHHFHSISSLRGIVLRLADEYGVSWVRAHRVGAGVVPQNPFYTTGRRESNGVAIPDHLIGVKWWLGYDPERLLAVLKTLEGTVELVVHPCTPEDRSFPDGVSYLPRERFQERCYLENLYPLLSRLYA